MRRAPATLVLADGTTFQGEAAGFQPDSGITTGEFVFNTALSGYQEVITDPSYAGQVIAFTYPHIGNYGVTPEDDEAVRPWCAGVVVRDLARLASSWRATGGLEEYLSARSVPVITGIDTRRLTRHLRHHGALPGAFGTADPAAVAEAARGALGTDGCDLASVVTTPEPYSVRGPGPRVVAVDYGIKSTMVRQLAARFDLTVVPCTASAEDILALEPEGVFLSNGPGDPAALDGAIAEVAALLGRVPVFGICLGHQLLARALGGRTVKLPFGHHGSNHPVKDLATGKVEITAQNHNYAVEEGTLARGQVTHVNLNDGVIEGIAVTELDCFSVQYHPEAGPGPHDARYLFDRFEDLIAKRSR